MKENGFTLKRQEADDTPLKLYGCRLLDLAHHANTPSRISVVK